MKHIVISNIEETAGDNIYFDETGSDDDGEGTEERPFLSEDRATRELVARVLKEPYRSNWNARVAG